MSNKRFLKIFLGYSSFTIIFIFTINYIIDPLWLFEHSNKFNQKQGSYDERQLKTNYLYYKLGNNFDGILLGSSRATYVNHNDFSNMNIFNYSSGAMQPYEYKPYIDFAKKIKGEDLKYIIIASDFFGTAIQDEKKKISPAYYFNTTLNSNKYKFLFSIDTFKKSINNIKYSLKGRDLYYDREAIKYHSIASEEKKYKYYLSGLEASIKNLSSPNYKYDSEYINILRTIKNENPNSKFIIYTSPISSDLLVSKIKNAHRWEEYKRWLNELIEVFGGVHNFMTINTVTNNLENYFDDNHLYPSVLKLLANKLSNVENKNIPEDFGVLVTKDNIDQHLENLRKQINDYDVNKTLK